ncbi:MAG: DUF2130 domain-containing protein [Clostridiales bacterium]|jgi:hypothetical protein|nr:DUF2130 domain-containing protein [Clostridiales bacterium]
MNIQKMCPFCKKDISEFWEQQNDQKLTQAVEQAVANTKKEMQHQHDNLLKQQVELANVNAKSLTQKELSSVILEVEKLKMQIKNEQDDKQKIIVNMTEMQKLAVKDLEFEKEKEKQQAVLSLIKENEKLKVELDSSKLLHQSNLNELEWKKENEKQQVLQQERQDKEKLKINLEYELQRKNEELEREKLYKSQLNIKLKGENLEIHCKEEFEEVRFAYPNAMFQKDNIAVKGDSDKGDKGDFIFRDFVDDSEIISIMFDMKDENDNSVNKKKNEDHLEKLNRDRQNKNCEYAVLVSTLEKDSDRYNAGIVDVSHIYPKMYVIRPQFFTILIKILTTTAQKISKDRASLAEYQKQNTDLVKFEANANHIKGLFFKHYTHSKSNFDKAISQIDSAIEALRETKRTLLLSNDQLLTATDRLNDLNVRNLAKKLPEVRKIFEEQEKQRT